MTKLMTTLTIAAIASVLIIGGFVASPEAYSTYGGGDDDHCGDEYHNDDDHCGDDEHDDDHCGDDEHDDDHCGDDESMPGQTGTIVIKNALTNDNGGEATFEDFTYKVTNEIGEETELVRDTLDPSIHVAEVPKGSYILSQTIASTTGSYTEVLITGDKKCPATTNESFMIKKDKTVSCTIYNDDNGTGESGEGGIIFRNFSMQVKLGDKMMANSCDLIPNAIDKNECIEIVNPSDGRFAIVDSALTSDTTIVSFSVLEAGQLETDTGSISPSCEIEAIVQHDKPSFFLVDQSDNESLPTNPSTNNVVVIKCAGTNMNSVYNVNYIMIDPTL